MNRECSITRDIMPLYLEGMVSEDTADFLREHLADCPECAAELASMEAGERTERLATGEEEALDEAVLKSMKKLRRRFRKKLCRVIAVIAAIAVAIALLLYFFPVYRITEIGPMTFGNYYSNKEIAMALYIGSAADRQEAQAVLRLADTAFNDVRHTQAENDAAYGLLGRYATDTDTYGDTAFNEHSLELWSAHLGKDSGWIWVYYSSETFNHDLTTACGSWHIPALWKVERDESGEWVVVSIREHP